MDSADCTCIPRGIKTGAGKESQACRILSRVLDVSAKLSNIQLRRLLNQETLGHTTARTADQDKGAEQHQMCAIGDKCNLKTRDLII